MIPTKNLHWLIRAQLAKRGHLPQVRIAPGAAPGHIAALRETNSGGDGKDHTKPPKIWKPKVVGPGVGHRVGGNVTPHLNPAVGAIPPDFSDIGYTALESKLDQLVHGADEWTDQIPPGQLIPWRCRSVLTSRQTTLEAWWDQIQPRIDINIEPWIMRYVDSATEPFSMDLLRKALVDLATQWSFKQRLMAEEGLALLGRIKDGRREKTQSYWGGCFATW